MKPIYRIVEGKAWSCISIFYDRKAWLDLLLEISSFYHDNESLFAGCLVYLSQERGDHIRITFSSDIDKFDALQTKMDEHFTLYLKYCPSICSKEYSLGKELWCHYPNNSLVWNRYEIRYQHMDYSLDKQIMTCLSGFQNSGLAEDKEEAEERAFEVLEQIQKNVADTPTEISLAKWGCLVECLVQNSFVEAEVDELLAETDEYLLALWQKMCDYYVDISQLFLWMGDYFLFRSCDKQSQFSSRFFQVLEQMLFRVETVFHKPEQSAIYVEPIFLFPTNIWQDMEWWLLRIQETSNCELVEKVLNHLYELSDSEILLQSKSPKNALRWQLRTCFFPN